MSTKPSLPPSDGSTTQPAFFETDSPDIPDKAQSADQLVGRPRLRQANREQVELRMLALDQLLPDDHRARVVWQYVDGLDLTPLYNQVLAVERHVGRAHTDPRILMALWLYATLEGVGSARELDKLCCDHVAYQWICGGVTLNYHTLADFRTAHGEFLDNLLTNSVATMMHEELVELKRVAQDGMRVRASAGSSSMRRRPTLEQCLEDAKEQVQTLQKEIDADPSSGSRRRQAARNRTAQERCDRVERALQELTKLEKQKAARGRDSLKKPARASTTDPEARKMKMADGGYRPAYNVQFSTDTSSQVIVGVEVTNEGSDSGLMAPMIEQIEQRYGQAPGEMLIDGGYGALGDIDEVSTPERGTVVYAPVKNEEKKRQAGKDPFAPQPGDSEAVAAWRIRMGTAEAKEIYKDRAATAECVNAIARNRGLYAVRVRGLVKVKAVVLWYVLAQNLMRVAALRAEIDKVRK